MAHNNIAIADLDEKIEEIDEAIITHNNHHLPDNPSLGITV